MFLLHGSGVDETTLIPLASEIDPDAAMIAARGRIAQDGGWRWFERITPTRFGQASIQAEAEAFADFITAAARRLDLDPAQATFLGYSNGANLITSMMLLRPGIVRRAILLRPMPVLDHPPAAYLGGVRILVVAGAADATYLPFAQALVDLLSVRGAAVETQTISAGHEFGATDTAIARAWLGRFSA